LFLLISPPWWSGDHLALINFDYHTIFIFVAKT
jgi:hypothetical protein